jgi:hypothetical protein
MAREMNLEDMEDMEAMLRKQIEVLQLEVDRLNKELMSLQILAGPRHEHDLWIIERKNADEFKT